jgi:hypothetical protein
MPVAPILAWPMTGRGPDWFGAVRDDLHAPDNEFLVVPGHTVELRNDGSAKLVIYRILPFNLTIYVELNIVNVHHISLLDKMNKFPWGLFCNRLLGCKT